MNEGIGKVRDLLAKIMEVRLRAAPVYPPPEIFLQPYLKKVQGAGFLHGNVDPKLLHPFRCQATMKEVHARKSSAWVISPLALLGALARCMGYLVSLSVLYSVCFD